MCSILFKDDRREQVTISTFGFLKNGFLQVKVNQLAFNPLIKLESMRNSVRDVRFRMFIYSGVPFR